MRHSSYVGVARVVVICAASVVSAPVASAGGDDDRYEPVPTATVNGPIPGQPASLSAVDLGPRAYVEEEFFVEGTARAYEPVAPLAEDGRWDVRTTTTAPYRTRVLVRRPKNPAKFNGVVQVEWLNVSGGPGAAPNWGFGDAELLPGRYGTLEHPGDGFSYDIYAQVGEALRRPTGTNLLGNRRYKIRTMIADGESQSAFRMVTYINAIQPHTGLFDGFFVHSRFAVGAAVSDGGAGAIPNPTLIPTHTKEPLLVLQSETDLPPPP